MFWSKCLLPTLKEDPQEAQSLGHKLSLKAGLVKILASGIYSYLPLGYRVLKKIENIIREEMVSLGGCEVLLPALQPLDLWINSGRDVVLGETMIRFIDRRGRRLCLGPTHEEVVVDLLKGFVSSYKQLPLIVFQIQTKFRDEVRPRFGLVRSCEFIMKDAYSFHKDGESLNEVYQKMHQSYLTIFARCGLKNVISLEADTGIMGGSESTEYMVLSESGEDKVKWCNSCKKGFSLNVESCPLCKDKLQEKSALEVGHIFKLGVKYSKTLELYFLDKDGSRKPVVMGCYGIGVSRLIIAIIECNCDSKGIIWPKEVAPFDVVLSCLDLSNQRLKEASFHLYSKLREQNIDVLFDERPEISAGAKLRDAQLIGVPFIVIMGKKFLEKGEIEVECRSTGEKVFIKEEQISNLSNILNKL